MFWIMLVISSTDATSSSMLTGVSMSVSTRSIAIAMFSRTLLGMMTILPPSCTLARG
jgi:hypothetical protein